MTHRAVIEVGPATIRRSCCDTESADAAAALEWIDDPVALVDGEPVEVPELLRSVLACPVTVETIEIIHPSWWPARRVELVVTVAHALADDVVTRPRFALLRQAFRAAVVIEIAARLVAITAAGIVAEPRIGAPEEVAEAVARRVTAAVRDRGAVLIDAPIGVGGAQALADMIAERLPGEVTIVDELPVSRAEPRPTNPEPAPAPARTGGRLWVPLTAAAVLSVVAVGVHAHPDTATALTNLVEGRVAVQVPADWSLRRVTAGPGSARVEVVSPDDPRLMLHITQAPAGGETLAAIAEPLQRAMELAEAETPGVFVGFDPAGSSAGRPAVTYREVRTDHHVDWAVLVDRAVRIGIGCQSGPDGGDDLRAVCEQAVRSAHALGSPPAR
ncbi:type VII secretion-associated protein [Mycolicibacter kumamotonensis]|jgi:type VII secretion-associated protein (TIGR03931 family)|uniref:Type VII secretion-associated protein n=1 Tax=Mycolicibacter kumamotonensis TaxID=354243 RepID=A0A1X0EBB5_9MYCO|nr:type VII secretion-associated protein [Mycolicibacter kumamotonensis]NDJ89163.1 type VII secretion-associated protein [Mycolicibacter kumamotonensis]ORA81887.1 type VII secretion-associated protein [Mycolicibacter kumamotonensis]